MTATRPTFDEYPVLLARGNEAEATLAVLQLLYVELSPEHRASRMKNVAEIAARARDKAES